MIDLETKCFQVIAQEIGSLFSPTLSDDLIEKLAYVKAANNQNQIVITSLNKNAKFCPRTKKTVTLFK
jgi:hypothetical protein